MGKFREKGIPLLKIDKSSLRNFCEKYGLEETKFYEIYSACSWIIHNQPPLPFFSLLEVKFFKYFLKRYLYAVNLVFKKIFDMEFEVNKIHTIPHFEEMIFIRDCLKIVDRVKGKYHLEIKEAVKRSLIVLNKRLSINPLTLISIFHLISPSYHNLRYFEFIEDDLENIIDDIQSVSHRYIRDEIHKTLNILQEILIPILEKYREFSSLTPKQKKTITFYLLLEYLPIIVNEILLT